MTALYSESFVGANLNPLNAAVWNNNGGPDCQLANNKAQGTTSGVVNAAYVQTVAMPADQYVKGVFSDAGTPGNIQFPSLMARFDAGATNKYYLALYDTVGGLKLFYFDGSGFTQLGISGTALTTGDVLELRCIGTTISVWLNGVSKISVTDANIAAGGRSGIWFDPSGFNPGPGFDAHGWSSFEAGDFNTGTLKTIDAIAKAQVKTVEAIAIASIKSVAGLTT